MTPFGRDPEPETVTAQDSTEDEATTEPTTETAGTDTEPATADTVTEPTEPGGDVQAGRGGYGDPAADQG